jgi:hypothetical protein
MKNLIQDLEESSDTIAFIDEIHQLLGLSVAPRSVIIPQCDRQPRSFAQTFKNQEKESLPLPLRGEDEEPHPGPRGVFRYDCLHR